YHAGIGGKIERAAIGESNADLAISSGLDRVASVNEVASLRLTDAIACGDVCLNDHGVGMFDCDRTGRRYHLSYGTRFEILCLRRTQQHGARGKHRAHD